MALVGRGASDSPPRETLSEKADLSIVLTNSRLAKV
jgi:hypothetical protein